MDKQQAMATIEAILFVSGDPVPVDELGEGLQLTPLEMEQILSEMGQALREDASRGLMLQRIEDSVQLVTKPASAELVDAILTPVKKASLSQAVLETLTIIAYQQPVTRAEIEQVRGVRCEYAVSTLQKYGLIEEVGRKDTLGRPILYGTTTEFLRFFGLESLQQLPDLSALPAADAPEGLEAEGQDGELDQSPENQETQLTVAMGPFAPIRLPSEPPDNTVNPA